MMPVQFMVFVLVAGSGRPPGKDRGHLYEGLFFSRLGVFKPIKIVGKYALDVLLENSDPELVKLEVDVYWVKHGGDDPVARMTRLGQRVVALHLKDMAAGPDQKFAEVGTGILDFKAILAAAEKTGAKYGAVEQDETYGTPPLDAIRTSFENLKKLGA